MGGDTKAFLGRPVVGDRLDLSGHRGVIDYDPTELVITARAGTPLAVIETLLEANGQRLAFEPPALSAASTIGGVVAAGLSGPRRPFSGAVRDSVLGVVVLDGRGQTLRLGGTVFKNVAGFDGFRLMAGAFGALGAILSVSLRVAPRPGAEAWRVFERDWPAAQIWVGALMRQASPLSGAWSDGVRLHLRLSGPQTAVAAQTRDLGGEDEAADIWAAIRNLRHPMLASPRLWRLSTPRGAKIVGLDGQWLWDWGGAQRWLATEADAQTVRAAAAAVGGHATLFRGARPDEAVFAPLAPPLLALHQRLKAAFDPAKILNPGRLYPDL